MYGAHRAITVAGHVHALPLQESVSQTYYLSKVNVQETVSLNAFATYKSQKHVH